MRNYIKIFSITISIQIVAVALGFVLAFEPGRGYSALPMLIVVGYVISLITDIYLAVKIDTILV